MTNQAGFVKTIALLAGAGALIILVFTGMRVWENMKAVDSMQEEEKIMDRIDVILLEQNDSGQSGEVVFQDVNAQTKIVISTQLKSTEPQPASIRAGSCSNLGAINYRLNDVVNGNSESTVAPSMHFLHGLGDLAIAVHKSNDEAGITIACANLKSAFDEEMK